MTAPENPSTAPVRRFPLWALLILLTLLLLALFGDKGVLRALQANRRQVELQAEVAHLEKANAELRKEIEALRNDRRTIENIARKELGMVKDDEIIYQFRNRPASSRAATVAAPGKGDTRP